MRARARLIAVVLMLLAGAIGVISSTQTWLTVTVDVSGPHDLPVSGASAMPILAPLSLAVLALGLAVTVVGRVLRYVFGALSLAIAIVLGWQTAQIAFTTPLTAVQSVVTKATGLAGIHAVTDLVQKVTATAWPALTLVAWVILALAGILTLVTAAAWGAGGRRYQSNAHAPSPAASGPLDALDSWDDLSRGDDPTAGEQPR